MHPQNQARPQASACQTEVSDRGLTLRPSFGALYIGQVRVNFEGRVPPQKRQTAGQPDARLAASGLDSKLVWRFAFVSLYRCAGQPLPRCCQQRCVPSRCCRINTNRPFQRVG